MSFRQLITLPLFVFLTQSALGNDTDSTIVHSWNNDVDSATISLPLQTESLIGHLYTLRAPKPSNDLVRVYDNGNYRFHCGIYLPHLNPDCMMDIGMTLAGWPVPFALVPRWFTNFGPTACNEADLYLSPKCLTAIQIKMRAYF